MFIPTMIIPYTLSVPRPIVSLILVVYIGIALMGYYRQENPGCRLGPTTRVLRHFGHVVPESRHAT
jgi:hypothetical protein